MPGPGGAAAGARRVRAWLARAAGRASGLGWPPVWSPDAALRALRATLVVPGLFALALMVIGNGQLALFAVFGSFATLVMTSFGGTRRDKLAAHAGLALVGSAAVIAGTAVSGSAWLAAIVTVPVAFAIFFAGAAGSQAATGVTAALLAYVLPVASPGPLSTIPSGSRAGGWPRPRLRPRSCCCPAAQPGTTCGGPRPRWRQRWRATLPLR